MTYLMFLIFFLAFREDLELFYWRWGNSMAIVLSVKDDVVKTERDVMNMNIHVFKAVD